MCFIMHYSYQLVYYEYLSHNVESNQLDQLINQSTR